MSSFNLKSKSVVDSLVRLGETYYKASFVHHKWVDQKVQYITILDTQYVDAYVELLNDSLSRDYNLTEYLFEMAKEFPGVYLCGAVLASKKENDKEILRKVDSRIILGNGNKFISSDDIFDMYKSACIYSHIGYPRTIEMSCSMRKRKICPDDNLLILSHTEVLEEKEEDVKGKVN